jgi:putative aldouronate transport system substrate-binding protein
MTTTGINVTTMAVSANCENPGRAMAFINLLNTNEELLNLICHGEEGVDWNWVDKEQKLIEATAGACPGNYAFLVGNGFIEYYMDPAMLGAWEETAQINATAAGSCILGFTFNAEPVSGELANMNALIKEQVNSILNGMAGDVDAAIAKLNADLYAAGLEIVLDEMQAQVDAWAATK